ncbi:MAG: heavy-metal-associated domain-containing protein [Hymenobacteraceae bacterium]|nr:heavy-metal-associated domain-containing protein [Hymenobacteraceae bacterium]MDX5396834.1 heavy-metal-associated domain-containing protein [Hymenobacteraceae bacterium]MDX5442180.1 heavy-metal-associated domain-containing protein [Hymenobacteraceae bacterium]MDX5512905.1 heavy-metal-associated domain-containing protein [Hymenobacteraceae bacterium]
MKTLKFKTNINCGGCVSSVTPFLNNDKNISHWEVDTNNPEKILTVQGENVTADEVKALVNEAGFKAEEKKGLFGKMFG